MHLYVSYALWRFSAFKRVSNLFSVKGLRVKIQNWLVGLFLKPIFESSKCFKKAWNFSPKCRMVSRTKLLFQFRWQYCNIAIFHFPWHLLKKKCPEISLFYIWQQYCSLDWLWRKIFEKGKIVYINQELFHSTM